MIRIKIKKKKTFKSVNTEEFGKLCGFISFRVQEKQDS